MPESRRSFLKTATGAALAGMWQSSTARSEDLDARPGSAVASVRYLGNQFLNNSVGVRGADGATSIVLPSGDALWVFGDTVEGQFDSIHGMDLAPLCSNTGAIVQPQDASRGIVRFQFLDESDGKRPRQLIPFAPDEDPAVHRIWGIHGTCVRDQLYVFYHRITLLKGVDVFANFQLDGMGIARAKLGDFRFTRLTAPDGTREFWKGDEPTFGVFVERSQDYVYLWGCLMTQMYLARTRPDAINDLSSYEYLVSAPSVNSPQTPVRWANEFEPTAPLFDSVPNEMSAAYNSHLRKYVAFHSDLREHKILLRTAPQITGPWSSGEVVYRPERIKGTDLIYATKEHPELAREEGRLLYVTFVNATTYIPQLIELRLN